MNRFSGDGPALPFGDTVRPGLTDGAGAFLSALAWIAVRASTCTRPGLVTWSAPASVGVAGELGSPGRSWSSMSVLTFAPRLVVSCGVLIRRPTSLAADVAARW